MPPSRALSLLAGGHAAWALLAYGRSLGAVVRDAPGSVGDGLFVREHAGDERAAAFWFSAVTPLLLLTARLLRAAEEAEDLPAQRTAGLATAAIGAAGAVVVPRSGFWAAMPLGGWMVRRSRRGPS